MPSERDKMSGLRFSMTTLFVVVAVAAICFTIAFSLPRIINLLVNIVFVVVATAGITSLAIYSSGNTRAFAIGAIFPQGVMLMFFITNGISEVPGGIPVDLIGTPTIVITPWIASALAGLICVGVRIKNQDV